MKSQQVDETILAELCAEAASVAVNAYAPYSGFRVGAAVLGEKGRYFGTNVENACGGLGICAERTAISAAIAAGERRILVVAVACIDAMPGHGTDELMPCGGCRQWLMELAPEAQIVIRGSEITYSVDDLLPNPFRLRHWKGGPTDVSE